MVLDVRSQPDASVHVKATNEDEAAIVNNEQVDSFMESHSTQNGHVSFYLG